MYYTRTFTATLDVSTSASRTILSNDTSGAKSAVTQRLALVDFIGESLETALQDCGFDNALWDSTNQLLYFNSEEEAALLIYGSTSLQNYYFCYTYVRSADGNRTRGIALISNTSATYNFLSTTTAGSAVSARMKVTIAGNPDGTFVIHLGNYANDGYYYLSCSYGKNEITNEKVLRIFSGNTSSTLFNATTNRGYVRNVDGTIPDEICSSEDSGYNVNFGATALTMTTSYGAGIVLRPFFTLDYNSIFSWYYTYFKPGNFTIGQFYEINNVTYVCFMYALVRITPVS